MSPAPRTSVPAAQVRVSAAAAARAADGPAEMPAANCLLSPAIQRHGLGRPHGPQLPRQSEFPRRTAQGQPSQGHRKKESESISPPPICDGILSRTCNRSFCIMTGDDDIDLSDAEKPPLSATICSAGVCSLPIAEARPGTTHFAPGPNGCSRSRIWWISPRRSDLSRLVSFSQRGAAAVASWRSRALGIKQDGRWVVFYSPGDMHDAWKTGHNNAASGAVRQAYELGVNVVKYGIDHYWAMNRLPVKKLRDGTFRIAVRRDGREHGWPTSETIAR